LVLGAIREDERVWKRMRDKIMRRVRNGERAKGFCREKREVEELERM